MRSLAAGASVPFDGLTPERILAAVESTGRRCDGRLLALNSYENRVYQIWIDERDGGGAVVAKFYRSGRWTDAQIGEEHAFALELGQAEVPVVAPLAAADGRTLFRNAGFRFALFPKAAGRAPELERPDVLERVGHLLGRAHSCGGGRRFRHRATLTIARLGEEPARFVSEQGFVPDGLVAAYRGAVDRALDAVRAAFAACGDLPPVRLHGDCHAGNILWTDAGPRLVDLDDCTTGAAVQDLWMLLSGDRATMTDQLRHVLRGYRRFRAFDVVELRLIEPLRTLRMIQYCGWIARRWDDPAFQAAFPWFDTPRYWQDHVQSLLEQIAALDEAPLDDAI
jgi:Ser/Thr protein kinase RdoA (MazF antagonist)